MNNDDIIETSERGETGAAIGGQVGQQAGGAAGQAVGAYFGGPVGAAIGQYVGEKVGEEIGEQVGDQVEEKIKEDQKKGGGCSGPSQGGQQPQCSDQCNAKQIPPRMKLIIEDNSTIPQNWWDRLPDFDPRVYDAIAMEQANACVQYIFKGLPDMHDLEFKMGSRAFRKICPRLKTQVPRTKLVKPKEIIYNTEIDTFIKKDETY